MMGGAVGPFWRGWASPCGHGRGSFSWTGGTGVWRRRLLPWVWSWRRTFAWLGRNRRLAKDYEENPGVSEAWVYLGMLRLLVKRLAKAA
jgi:hypothetical protein